MSLFFLLLAVGAPILLLLGKAAGRVVGFTIGMVIFVPFMLVMAFREPKAKRNSIVRN